MNRLKPFAVATLALALAAGPALAQYYTPLRYDLRYTSPTYIPSGTMRFGPENRDPYRYGAPLQGNLGITGNLRLGKSFRGTSPYRATGSQMAIDLPSLGLSEFRRDSFGVEDLGTGLQYGGTAPYFPGSGSVTTPYTAGTRFAPQMPGDRAPYLPAGVNPPPLPVPSGQAAAGPAGGDYQTASPAIDRVYGTHAAGLGVTVPQSAIEFVDALIDGRVQSLPAGTAEPPDYAGTAEPRKTPADLLERQFQVRPDNVLEGTDRPGAAPPKPTVPESPSALYWLKGEEPAPSSLRLPDTQDAAPGLAPAVPGTPGTAWPAEDEADDEPVPAGPRPYQPASTYAAYVIRAHAAMADGAYDKAEALYAAAASLEADRPAAFFGRVNALLGRRLYLQAALVLERGLLAHADWGPKAPDLKAVYPKPDVYDRIVANIKGELEVKPDDVALNFLLGYVYYAAGDKAGAKRHLEHSARARDPEAMPEKGFLEALANE